MGKRQRRGYRYMPPEIWTPSEELAKRLASQPKFSLKDLRPEVTRLGKDQLDFAAFVYVADKLTNTGQCKEYELEYYLGHQILRFFLGDEWTEKSIFDHTPSNAGWYRKSRAFLRSDSSDVRENVRHQDRVIKLAECLYNLQHVSGMAERVALIEKESLESVFSEFQCARIMASPALQMRFVIPQGNAQSDYDAEITTPAGRPIFCEIKAKEEGSDVGQKTVENSIEVARKQLPKDQPGLVWITIPEQWASQIGTKAVVDKAIERAFRNSDRLVAIVAAWEVWIDDGDFRSVQYRFHPTLNTESSYYRDDIESAIDLFGSYKNDEWVELRAQLASRLPTFVNFVEEKIRAGEVPGRHPRPQ
jgi:hypothetical protein